MDEDDPFWKQEIGKLDNSPDTEFVPVSSLFNQYLETLQPQSLPPSSTPQPQQSLLFPPQVVPSQLPPIIATSTPPEFYSQHPQNFMQFPPTFIYSQQPQQEVSSLQQGENLPDWMMQHKQQQQDYQQFQFTEWMYDPSQQMLSSQVQEGQQSQSAGLVQQFIDVSQMQQSHSTAQLGQMQMQKGADLKQTYVPIVTCKTAAEAAATLESVSVTSAEQLTVSKGEVSAPWPRRSEEQKELNRHAQKRYRDRKRNAYLGIEASLRMLTQEADRLRAIKNEKEQLEVKTSILNESIINIDSQIAQAKTKLQQIQDEQDIIINENPGFFEGAQHQEAQNHIEQMHQNMAALFSFMQKNEIHNPGQSDIYSAQLDPQLKSEFQNLVFSVGRACIETIKYGSHINIKQMINASRENFSKLFSQGMAPWSNATPELWIEIVSSIGLQQEQIRNLLNKRVEFLQKFGQLFDQRQSLNREIVRLMLPQQQREEEEEEEEEGDGESFPALQKAVERAQYQQQLNDFYNQLKNNLRQEQKYYSQLNQVVLEILTVTQVGWIFRMCYPEHCDCLAIVNAVYEVYQEQEISGQKVT